MKLTFSKSKHWIMGLAASAALVVGISAAPVAAAVVYDESVSGDLGTISAPTSIVLGLGSNEIIGEVGVNDRSDAYQLILGSLKLVAIEVLGIEIDSGSTVRFSNCFTVAASCGFTSNENAGTSFQENDLGGDLLADLLSASPIGPITNLFEMVESEGPSRYRLNFVTATAQVPLPLPLMLLASGLGAMALVRRKS